jgi:diguanylate cyclase (GGDEF)-like protein
MKGPRRLLLVDDQPANIHVLAQTLQGSYELLFATSGARALELARGGVDLVLLDVQMPGMDGLEVCRRLKEDDATRGIPVVFVTALGEVEDETRGFDTGAVDYITKPISPPVVRARVRTHIELKEARDLLEELASIDSLTGIANRRRFDARLEEEWRRARRGGHWLSLAILDVDHFKSFNDRYGHARGDACLRAVAQALGAACRRPTDLAARYGGEEFALVLGETDARAARERARDVLARVEALGIEHASPFAPHVTVSLGAVSLVPADGLEPAGALARADALLYEAKSGGRRHGRHVDLATGEASRIEPAGGGGTA